MEGESATRSADNAFLSDEVISDVTPLENSDNSDEEDVPHAGIIDSASKERKRKTEELARKFAKQKRFSGPLLPSEVNSLNMLINLT